MNRSNFLRVFALVAFIMLCGVSCWATVESLHLLLPTWPVIFFWAITVVFFVVSSIGSKMIVDSFNQRIRVENRNWRLIGGIILLFAFWTCFSLPTNSHTFFYRAVINDVLVKDLTETKAKLQNLGKDGEAGKIIEQEKADFRNKINNIFSKFAAEINNPGDFGWDVKAEAVIIELEGELGEIQRLKLRSNTHAGRQELIMAMRKQIDDLTESKIKNDYDKRLELVNRELNKEEIKHLIAEIQKVQNKMQALPTTHGEPTEKTSQTLTKAYSTISNYSDILIKEFEKSNPGSAKMAKETKDYYMGISKTERMCSVVEVWKDFFNGKFAGRGFIFWILLGALVDIAGFIFFDIAFKKEEY
jgi:hypothetical protein